MGTSIDNQRLVDHCGMRVFSRRTLADHWQSPHREDSADALKAWFAEAEKAVWKHPKDIKAKFRNASFVADNRVIFNIAGNKYRLVVHVSYEKQTVMIKFIGTHSEYDQITAKIVGGGKK